MKNVMMPILTAFVVCSLFVACNNPMSVGEEYIGNGGGLVTVTIGDTNARKVVDWANALEPNQLSHTIIFSGGPGTVPPPKAIPAGGGTARFSVTPGQWTITANAYYSGYPIAEGSVQREIKKGYNEITISMHEPPNHPRYTVTFNANGGSPNSTENVKGYCKVPRPSPPTRSGNNDQNMVFIDWFTEPASRTRYDFDTPVTENITLYAGWR